MFWFNYLKRRKLEVDIEVQEYREELYREVEDLALLCARDKGAYEHEYHYAKEILGIEIAKLEAKKEILSTEVTVYEKLLEVKDNEIKRLTDICLKLGEHSGGVITK